MMVEDPGRGVAEQMARYEISESAVAQLSVDWAALERADDPHEMLASLVRRTLGALCKEGRVWLDLHRRDELERSRVVISLRHAPMPPGDVLERVLRDDLREACERGERPGLVLMSAEVHQALGEHFMGRSDGRFGVFEWLVTDYGQHRMVVDPTMMGLGFKIREERD